MYMYTYIIYPMYIYIMMFYQQKNNLRACARNLMFPKYKSIYASPRIINSHANSFFLTGSINGPSEPLGSQFVTHARLKNAKKM